MSRLRLAVGAIALLWQILTPALADGQRPPAAPGTIRCPGLPHALYRTILRERFTNLASARGDQTSIPSAAVDLKEATAAVTVTSTWANGSTLAVRLSGTASNGLLPLLSGDKLNTDLSASIEYHFLNKQPKQVLRYDLTSCEAYHVALDKLRYDYERQAVEAARGRSLLELDTLRLTATHQRLNSAIDQLRGSTDAVATLRRDSRAQCQAAGPPSGSGWGDRDPGPTG